MTDKITTDNTKIAMVIFNGVQNIFILKGYSKVSNSLIINIWIGDDFNLINHST